MSIHRRAQAQYFRRLLLFILLLLLLITTTTTITTTTITAANTGAIDTDTAIDKVIHFLFKISKRELCARKIFALCLSLRESFGIKRMSSSRTINDVPFSPISMCHIVQGAFKDNLSLQLIYNYYYFT